jgi:hypothetical protein
LNAVVLVDSGEVGNPVADVRTGFDALPMKRGDLNR